jgi:hypothetical protein
VHLLTRNCWLFYQQHLEIPPVLETNHNLLHILNCLSWIQKPKKGRFFNSSCIYNVEFSNVFDFHICTDNNLYQNRAKTYGPRQVANERESDCLSIVGDKWGSVRCQNVRAQEGGQRIGNAERERVPSLKKYSAELFANHEITPCTCRSSAAAEHSKVCITLCDFGHLLF